MLSSIFFSSSEEGGGGARNRRGEGGGAAGATDEEEDPSLAGRAERAYRAWLATPGAGKGRKNLGSEDTSSYSSMKLRRPVEWVSFLVPDMDGASHGVTVHGDSAARVILDKRAEIAANYLRNGRREEGKEAKEEGEVIVGDVDGDAVVVLVPDMDTFSRGKDAGVVFCTPFRLAAQPEGAWPACPRETAVRVLCRLQSAHDVLLQGIFDLEFFFTVDGEPAQSGCGATAGPIIGGGGAATPAPMSDSTKSDCISFSGPCVPHTNSLLHQFITNATATLREQSIRIVSYRQDTEGRVLLCFSDAVGVTCADRAFLARSILKESAARFSNTRQRGSNDDQSRNRVYDITFASKPWPDRPVVACMPFTHTTCFAAQEESPLNTPTHLDAFRAGQAAHAAGLAALLQPTAACHRPAGVGMEAVVREVARPDPLLRNSAASSAANPYLVLAGLVAAGTHGLEAARDGSAALESQVFPDSLDAALDALEADTVLCSALGTQFVEQFVSLKRRELTQAL